MKLFERNIKRKELHQIPNRYARKNMDQTLIRFSFHISINMVLEKNGFTWHWAHIVLEVQWQDLWLRTHRRWVQNLLYAKCVFAFHQNLPGGGLWNALCPSISPPWYHDNYFVDSLHVGMLEMLLHNVNDLIDSLLTSYSNCSFIFENPKSFDLLSICDLIDRKVHVCYPLIASLIYTNQAMDFLQFPLDIHLVVCIHTHLTYFCTLVCNLISQEMSSYYLMRNNFLKREKLFIFEKIFFCQ